MTEHTPSNRPLWEEFSPTTGNQLIGLMAEEAWLRTRSPIYDTQICEVELAHVRAGGSWHTYLALESLYRDESTEKGCQCALFGFTFAAALRGQPRTVDPHALFDRTMRLAELVPLSPDARKNYEARAHRAMAERCRIQKEKTE